MIKKSKHFAIVLGARPNFVKAAPFLREAKNHSWFKYTLIHTGQHFDSTMSKIFFDEMSIPRPDIRLNVNGNNQAEKIGNMVSGLKKIFSKRKFDGVIVFGDINSTLAGAISSVKNNRLIHIESGLRSHDKRMPEETNRLIVDHLSDILFTTEPDAKVNLIREGISKNKIKEVGNIMIESLEKYANLIERSEILNDLELQTGKYVVATIHRAENTDNPDILKKIMTLLQKFSKKYDLIMPLHPNTKKKMREYNLKYLLSEIKIIEPLGYFDFIKLIKESRGIITDSGGIQEETSHLGVPCVTLRDNTERPITITLGSNKLFSIEELDSSTITDIEDHINRVGFKKGNIPLWDDKVSKRIFSYLKYF